MSSSPSPTVVEEYKVSEPAPSVVPAATPLEPTPPAIATHPAPAAVPTLEKPRRLAALDVFRGITIAAMVLANSSSHPYPWLEHATWHGWTPTDLIFPFFLFIVGVATPFSLAKRSSTSSSRGALVGRIWVRALSLVLLGHLLSAIYAPVPFHDAVNGFGFTKAYRDFGFVYCWAAIVLLLTPWPWRRLSTWMPILLAVIFYGYLIGMHFVRAHALANGWPDHDVPFGGSINKDLQARHLITLTGGGSFNPDNFRIPGVLVRIGICYGVAATIALFAGWRSIVAGVLALFIAYSAIMLAVPIQAADGQRLVGSLTEQDNVARRVDVAVFERSTVAANGDRVYSQKHTWRDYPDNEGILSTLPAIGTALLGVLVGRWLRTPRTPMEHAAGLLAYALPVIILGCVLNATLMPINKNLWTPSFTIFTAGLAMLTLGSIFYFTDVRGRRAWAWPFTVMGMNAIVVFAASTVVPRVCSYIEVPDHPLTTIHTRYEPDAPARPARAPAKQPLVPANTHATHQVHDAVIRASNWLMNASHGRLPLLATEHNLSLAWSICFLFVIFLITLLLWSCRIFVKV